MIKSDNSILTSKRLQMNKHNLIVEIRPRGPVYDIEKIYTPDQKELSMGDLFEGEKVDSKLYDTIYQDIDDGQFFEV
jgi:hypothetical protein